MKLNFRYITDKFEKPMLNGNEAWCTNNWVYVITGLLGAINGWLGIREYFTGASFGEAALAVTNFGILYTLLCWAGCTAIAYIQIPDKKMAFRRSMFNLVTVAVMYFACAILSVLALIAICLMIIFFFMSAGAASGKTSRGTSSSGSDTIYDGEGNIHYVNSSISNNRIQTSDGKTMRREADGTYRDL